jgi:hypothetical protein
MKHNFGKIFLKGRIGNMTQSKVFSRHVVPGNKSNVHKRDGFRKICYGQGCKLFLEEHGDCSSRNFNQTTLAAYVYSEMCLKQLYIFFKIMTYM